MYYYIAQNSILKGKCGFMGGCLHARNSIEAWRNATILVKERGGIISNLIVEKL